MELKEMHLYTNGAHLQASAVEMSLAYDTLIRHVRTHWTYTNGVNAGKIKAVSFTRMLIDHYPCNTTTVTYIRSFDTESNEVEICMCVSIVRAWTLRCFK